MAVPYGDSIWRTVARGEVPGPLYMPECASGTWVLAGLWRVESPDPPVVSDSRLFFLIHVFGIGYCCIVLRACSMLARGDSLSSAADPRSRFGFGKFKVFRIDYCLLIAFVHTGHCCG